jgi:flagellar hook-length control protein FliK
MESKFSKLQVDVPKAALQGDGKGAKSPVSAEFKAALSAELESIARAQNPGKDTAESAALQRLSNGKNMPLIASGLISPKSSYSLETVLPDISTKDFDVYVLGPQVPESRFVLRSKELAESSLYRSQVVANPMVKGAVLPDANKRTPSPDAKDVSLISRVGVLPGQRQLDSVRGEAVAVRSKITELFTPVGTDPKSIREQSPIQGFDDAIRGSGPTANRVAPDAQMTPPIAQQALASTDDAVRGSGPAANRVTPEAQMTPAVAQRALASTDDAVRGSGPTANRVTPEAQMTPTVAQRALASTDDAVRGSGPTANRVTPEAQMTPAVAQQALASTDDAVRGAGPTANRVTPEAQMTPAVAQQAPSPMSEAVLSRNAAPPAAAEIVLSNSPARGTEAKNKTAGKAVNEAVDVKLAKLEAELSGREAHKPRSGELVNKGEKLETKLIRGLELKDAHVPQRSAETLTAYLPIADDITASKPTDGKAISGEFTYHSEARVSSGVSADRSSFDSKVMANNSTDRASLSAGGAGSAFTAAIGKQLIDKISAGTERVRLVLHPKELGVVDVTMDVKNGKVDAILASANPVTREMLGDNLGRLRESLMQAGFDSGDVEVSDRPASDGSSDQKGAAPTAMQFVDTDGAVKSKDEITEIDLFLDSDEIDFWV